MVLMPRASLALAACLALSSLPSAASLVTVQFGGSVTRSLVDGVSRGDRIVGYYTFDTAAVDIFENTPTTPVADGSGPRVGIYEQSTAAAFRVNDFVFITRFPTIADGYSGGLYVIDDIGGSDGFSVNALGFSLSMQDPTRTAFDSDDLPATPPDPARFLYRQFYFGWDGDIIGSIDTLVIGPPNVAAAVPLPATPALVLAGLGLLATQRRRR